MVYLIHQTSNPEIADSVRSAIQKRFAGYFAEIIVNESKRNCWNVTGIGERLNAHTVTHVQMFASGVEIGLKLPRTLLDPSVLRREARAASKSGGRQ